MNLVGHDVPVTVLNFLPKDDTIQNIRVLDDARHKKIVSFKSKVAKAAYENGFALVEAFLPVSNWAAGLDANAKDKYMATKFEKVASLAISAFKAAVYSAQGGQSAGNALVNPALLPESPPKTASNGCPAGNSFAYSNQPDKQLTDYLVGLTSAVDANAKLMQQMASQNLANQATQNLAQQANQILPPPVPNQNLLRLGN